ncbi:MAG: ABC transporter permease [Planctomycetota bacterium]|nr:ABC transporter permease [Planctomycetota bacterium]
MIKSIPKWIRASGPPVGTFLALLVVWEAVVRVTGIQRFVLPSPLQILEAAWKQRAALVDATCITAMEALSALTASVIVGSAVACVFSQSKPVRASLFPYAIFLQTVPIVAIAPLIVIWFNAGFHSVVLVSFIISVFPIISNMTAGLMAVDQGLIDLFQLNRASRWQVLWKLRLPNSVPHLVTGVKTSSGAAVIGAIVGEFFAGQSLGDSGLGYHIQSAVPLLQTDLLFATVFASTFLGVTIFGSVSLIGSWILARRFD